MNPFRETRSNFSKRIFCDIAWPLRYSCGWCDGKRVKPLGGHESSPTPLQVDRQTLRLWPACSSPKAPRLMNREILPDSSSQVKGSRSQNLGEGPARAVKWYLGFIFRMISSRGGEPGCSNSGGRGKEQCDVMEAGQSLVMKMSTSCEVDAASRIAAREP